jgi:hypothetical protein
VAARFVRSGKRDRSFTGADAAHAGPVTSGQLTSGGLVLGDDDVSRDGDVGPVKVD